MKVAWAKKYTWTSEMLQTTWLVVQVPGRSKVARPETRRLGREACGWNYGRVHNVRGSLCLVLMPTSITSHWLGRLMTSPVDVSQPLSSFTSVLAPWTQEQSSHGNEDESYAKPNNRTALSPRPIQQPCCSYWGWQYCWWTSFLCVEGLILSCQYGPIPWGK